MKLLKENHFILFIVFMLFNIIIAANDEQPYPLNDDTNVSNVYSPLYNNQADTSEDHQSTLFLQQQPYQSLYNQEYPKYEEKKDIIPQKPYQSQNIQPCKEERSSDNLVKNSCSSRESNPLQQDSNHLQYPYISSSVQDQLSTFRQPYVESDPFLHAVLCWRSCVQPYLSNPCPQQYYNPPFMWAYPQEQYDLNNPHLEHPYFLSYAREQQDNTSFGHSYHVIPSQIQPNEHEQPSQIPETGFHQTSNSNLTEKNILREEKKLSTVKNEQNACIAPLRFSEEQQDLYMNAKRRRVEDNATVSINNEVETQLTSPNLQENEERSSTPQNQHNYAPNTIKILEQKILTSNNMCVPNYEKYFEDIIADYTKFENLEITKSFNFIKKLLNDFHFTNDNDLFADFTLDSFKKTERFIEYSDDEKKIVEYIDFKLLGIFYQMDTSITGVLSIENMKELILNSQKYVEIEKEFLNSLNNDIIFQKYILNYIKKVIEENELSTTILFCEMISLKSFIWIKFKSIFYRGNGLRMIYLFKILVKYSDECEAINLHKMHPKNPRFHQNIKPTRYILRRIILEIAYNTRVSQDHIRFFPIISYFDLFIYKISKNKLKERIPLKKIVLFDTLGSIFFTFKSNEIILIKKALDLKVNQVNKEYFCLSESVHLKKRGLPDKIIEELAELFYCANLSNYKSFLLSVFNNFLLLIEINENSKHYKIKHRINHLKKVKDYYEKLLVEAKCLNESNISIHHIKLTYMIFTYMVFSRLGSLSSIIYGGRYYLDLEKIFKDSFVFRN